MTYLPFEYWFCLLVAIGALAFALYRYDQPWSTPFIAIVCTAIGWYLVEPFLFPEQFDFFAPETLSTAFGCFILFLIGLFFSTSYAVRVFYPNHASVAARQHLNSEQLIKIVIWLWLCLLTYGTFRMEGDLIGALFPIDGRAGLSMWQRAAGADAGADGFIVSSAAYLYILVLSSFGLLLVVTTERKMQLLLLLCIAVSWPYAFLQGSRNITLSVVIPGIAGYLVLGRGSVVKKMLFLVGSFSILNVALLYIVEFRNIGFRDVGQVDLGEANHLGLNMLSELAYSIEFIRNGSLDLSYGQGYVADLILNAVPRAFWADKPLLGIDYAIARGYGGQDSDIGVAATIATGIIGQGVQNFGVLIGPFVAGILAGVWVAILTRLRIQGGAARNGLFLIGIGLTFNLGRGIGLLVLFPFVFGYIGIVLMEAMNKNIPTTQQRWVTTEMLSDHKSGG